MTASSRELDARRVAPEVLAPLAASLDAGYRAAAGQGEVRVRLCVAGRVVEVAVASPALARRLLTAWRPLITTSPDAPPDVTWQAWTSEPAGVAPPDAPIDLRDRWWRGVLADTPEFAAQLQGPIRILSVFDRAAATGHWWMPALDDVPGWETAAPMRALLHWWAGDLGLHLTHAAAVGRAGQGVLLAGKGGVGKSATALSCLAAGMAFVGDDYVLTALEGQHDVTAHVAYATAKLDPERLAAWFPDRPSRLLTEPGGKAVVPVPADALTERLGIRALVLPVIDPGAPPGLAPVATRAAMLALAPSTVFQLPCSGPRAVRHLAEVARRLPTYRLTLSPEPEVNAAALDALVAAGGRHG